MLECLRPKVGRHCLGPPVVGVQQHGSGRFGGVADSPLGHAVLVMCADAAEGDGLPGVADSLKELSFSKAAVVGVVVLASDAVLFSEPLECLLGFDRFVSGQRVHEVDVSESRVVIGKDSGSLILLCSWRAFRNGNKTCDWGFELVDRHTFTRLA